MATAEELKGVPWHEVKEIHVYLLSALGLPSLDGNEVHNRGWARQCIVKFGGIEKTKLIIVAMVKDPFHRRNLTSFRYLLNNGMKFYNEQPAGPKGVFIS